LNDQFRAKDGCLNPYKLILLLLNCLEYSGSDKPSESDAKKMSESLDIKKTVGIKVVLKINYKTSSYGSN